MGSSSKSSSSSSSLLITGEEMKSFHWIERDIFGRLVIELGHDVEQSVRAIGLWLWLEEIGFRSLTLNLKSRPDFIVNLVFNEALSFLSRLETINHNEEGEDISMGLTVRLLSTPPLSPLFLYEKKASAIRSIQRFVTKTAPGAFDDIIHKALLLSCPAQTPAMVPSSLGFHLGSLIGPSHCVAGVPSSSDSYPMVAKSPVPLARGPSISPTNPMVGHPPNPIDLLVTPNDRTLYVTFSRGYPISEGELHDFFTSNFGDCVECIYLQGLQQRYEHSLFGLIVLRSPVFLDLILQRAEEDGKVKFVINGKHARARKYFTSI